MLFCSFDLIDCCFDVCCMCIGYGLYGDGSIIVNWYIFNVNMCWFFMLNWSLVMYEKFFVLFVCYCVGDCLVLRVRCVIWLVLIKWFRLIGFFWYWICIVVGVLIFSLYGVWLVKFKLLFLCCILLNNFLLVVLVIFS